MSQAAHPCCRRRPVMGLAETSGLICAGPDVQQGNRDYNQQGQSSTSPVDCARELRQLQAANKAESLQSSCASHSAVLYMCETQQLEKFHMRSLRSIVGNHDDDETSNDVTCWVSRFTRTCWRRGRPMVGDSAIRVKWFIRAGVNVQWCILLGRSAHLCWHGRPIVCILRSNRAHKCCCSGCPTTDIA